MADSLLQIVQTVCDELGLKRPAAVANSTDTQIRQIYALLNREARELQQNYNWTALQAEHSFTLQPPIITTGNTTKGSALITNVPVDVLAPVTKSWVCAGQGIPVAARVVARSESAGGDFGADFDASYPVVTGDGIALSAPATATAENVPLIFAKDTYAGPDDFDRYISETWWDRTNRWALLGPDSPQVDQWHRSGIATVGPRRHFRQIGFVGAGSDYDPSFDASFAIGSETYRLWPPPGTLDAPLTLSYEYISRAVAVGSGANQERFLADDDVSILDPQMLVLGVKWRLWQIKGFDYEAMQQEYQDYVDRRYANDGGTKTLSLTRGGSGHGLGAITQDANFPGPVGPNMV